MFRHCSNDITVDLVESSWGSTMLELKAKPEGVVSSRIIYGHALRRHGSTLTGGVILHAGEVDAAHLVHLRARQRSESVERSCAEAVSRFVEFTKTIVEPSSMSASTRIYIVPAFVTMAERADHNGVDLHLLNGRADSRDVPWEERVNAAKLINQGLHEAALNNGWVMLEHPFAPGAGGDGKRVARELLGKDGIHFKYSFAWSWLYEGLRRVLPEQEEREIQAEY